MLLAISSSHLPCAMGALVHLHVSFWGCENEGNPHTKFYTDTR